MKKQQLLGSLLLLAVAVIWGTAFVFQRVGMDSIEPVTFTASRMTLSAVAVGILALFLNKKEIRGETAKRKPSARYSVIGGVFCGIFLASASIFQQKGIVYTTAGKAGFITAFYILLVPVIGFVIFRKRNIWLVWLAVLLGIAGMYLLCITDGFRLAQGDTYVFICAVLFSGHILCVDYFVRKGNAVQIAAFQFAAAAVISWAAAFITETPGPEKIISALVPIAYCGLISGGVGYTLQIVAQKYTDPAVASLLMSLESVFAVIAGALILHERMSSRELVGCIVMFVSIIIAQIPVPSGRKTSDKE